MVVEVVESDFNNIVTLMLTLGEKVNFLLSCLSLSSLHLPFIPLSYCFFASSFTLLESSRNRLPFGIRTSLVNNQYY